jgi:hypothetical protein
LQRTRRERDSLVSCVGEPLKRSVGRFIIQSMPREIKESDWRVFRGLHGIALERFSQRVLEEVRLATTDIDDSYHECYLKVYALIRNRDKTMALTFDNPRRSVAIIQLANIVDEGLLTDDELNQFSAETREAVEVIQHLRRA